MPKKRITDSLILIFVIQQGSSALASDTIHPYVGYGVTHNDNLFRFANDAEAQAALGSTAKSDTYQNLTLGIKADIPVSRQRFILNANGRRFWFNRFDQLNHNESEALAQWNWQIGNDWSGKAGHQYSRTLAPFTELQIPVLNMRDQNNTFLDIDYLIDARWSSGIKLNHYRLEYDLESQHPLNRTEDSAALDLWYKTRADSQIGVEVERTQADFPFRQIVASSAVDNQYRQNEFNLLAKWNYSEKTKFEGKAGYTERKHEQVSARDFNGATGRALMDWSPSVKTKIVTSVWREIGAVEELTASYTLNRGIGIAPSWDPTVKINVQANYNYELRDFRGDPGLFISSAELRKDKVHSFRLAFTYKAFRAAQLGLIYQREQRSSNVSLSEYTFNSVTGILRAEF